MNIQIVTALITLGSLGLLFGIVLAIASKVFFVKKDPRIEKIDEVLPQVNCGACGYPGCAGYSEGIVNDEADVTLCAPGGSEVIEKIAQIMGLEASAAEPKIAVVRCQGTKENAIDKFEYTGIKECNAASLVSDGHKACEYGCLGFGSCVDSCPFDAMAMKENGLPIVFEDKCTGCGNCVEACPKGIMELIPKSQKVYLGCVNQNKAKAVKSVCSVGCIGCTLCSKPKVTPSGVIIMENNIPLVPAVWEDWQNAVEKCPTDSFVVRGERPQIIEAEKSEEKAEVYKE
ncbi:MAG: Fe-S cluster domain-containing protein [Calditrichia bacterium]|nr:Fe-S cluster domain-containing protein [Calditrichia bacterium]